MRLHRLFIDLDEGRANGLNAEQVMVLAAVRYLSRDTPWKRNNAELAEMLCSKRDTMRRRLDELLSLGMLTERDELITCVQNTRSTVQNTRSTVQNTRQNVQNAHSPTPPQII